MEIKRREKRGAKKGENRFEQHQKNKVDYRLKRVKKLVIPKIRAICQNTYFKNVTSYRKVCAEIYNTELPVGETEISYRTLGNKPYWDELGYIYYSFFGNEKSPKIDMIRTALAHAEELEDIKSKLAVTQIQLEEKNKELSILETALLKNQTINPLAPNNTGNKPSKQSHASDTSRYVDDFAAIINWLIERSDNVIKIDKENNRIIDLSDDLDGILDTKISKTFFMYLNGKLH